MNTETHIQRGQRVATLRPVSLAVLAAILFAMFAASVTMVAAQSPLSPQEKPRVVAGTVTSERWSCIGTPFKVRVTTGSVGFPRRTTRPPWRPAKIGLMHSPP